MYSPICHFRTSWGLDLNAELRSPSISFSSYLFRSFARFVVVHVDLKLHKIMEPNFPKVELFYLKRNLKKHATCFRKTREIILKGGHYDGGIESLQFCSYTYHIRVFHHASWWSRLFVRSELRTSQRSRICTCHQLDSCTRHVDMLHSRFGDPRIDGKLWKVRFSYVKHWRQAKFHLLEKVMPVLNFITPNQIRDNSAFLPTSKYTHSACFRFF